MDDDLERDIPVVIIFAGSVCRGWSAVGGRLMFSHESENAHSI